MRIRTSCVTVALALSSVLAATAQAQVATGGTGRSSVGVIGGFNMVSIAFDPSVSDVLEGGLGFDGSSSGGVHGIAAGIALDVPLGRPRLRIEGLFSQGGGKFGASIDNIAEASPAGATSFGINGAVPFSFESRVRLNTLEVPVMILFPVGTDDRVRIMGGAFLAYTMSQSETFTETIGGDSDETTIEGDEQTQLKKTSFGIALGAEVRVAPRVGVGGRFNLGLTNIADDDALPFDSIKFRTVRIYVIFSLN